ncbi:MAG: peptide chain release factor N(5)-glutamine methyltransferase [Gammaproteobacteria bacterium]
MAESLPNGYFSKSGLGPRPTVESALEWATHRLANQLATPKREAQLLLAECLGCPLTRLFTEPARSLEPDLLARFEDLVMRRESGEPLAYLSGHWGFWSLDFEVNRHTLVPRPETEALVAQALHLIPEDRPGRLLDLGTGCGALAITLARERPGLEIWATDQSCEALAVARGNARALGTPSIVFRAGDWFEALPQGLAFDWIVSNPPYLSDHDPALDTDGIRFEPRTSLVAGPTGLEALCRIIEGASDRLRPPGWLIVEHAREQASALDMIFKANGWQEVAGYQDVGGHTQGTFAAWLGHPVPEHR